MAIIHPFKGIRPQESLAAAVASRPYDVLNRAEAKAEASSPNSFLHIIRAEIDLADTISPYSEAVYQKAKENFEQAVATGVFQQEDTPCLYLYAQEMDGHRQVGIVAGTSINDYLNDVIKKHEYTRPAKEQDRINHITTTRIHSGPVLTAYPQVDEIDAIVATILAEKAPIYDFTAVDGIKHTVWVVSEEPYINALVDLFADRVPAIYIADGHHRAASSTKVGVQCKSENPNHNGKEEYNYFLSVLFPDNQLQIIDYNRVLTDLNELTKDEFLEKLAQHFTLTPVEQAYKPTHPHHFGLYLDHQWYELKTNADIINDEDPIDCLDITILSNYVIAPILGIKDQRRDNRIDFVGGIRGMKELERRVDSGEMALAFSIYPVNIQQLIDVANSGTVMPPKSTWFEPKLRSGLIVHAF